MNIYLHPLERYRSFLVFKLGTLAQLVEQRTENPCVPGSIPGGTTKKSRNSNVYGIFCFSYFRKLNSS